MLFRHVEEENGCERRIKLEPLSLRNSAMYRSVSVIKKTYSTSRFSSDENTLFAKCPMLLEDKSLQKMNQD